MLIASPEQSLPTTGVATKWAQVLDQVRTTSLRTGRDPAAVKILAASKQKTVAEIRYLVEQGFSDIGESYVSEALPKLKALATTQCSWHYIGVVQSNKTRALARYFDWVQSIDRAHIGKRLASARSEYSSEPLNVCVQVNVDDEVTKAGVSVAAAPELVEQLNQFPQLQVRGLMAIPNPSSNRAETRTSFRRMRELFEQIQPQNTSRWDTLSMGMSADFVIAIEEGATMVRLGTVLFGPRT